MGSCLGCLMDIIGMHVERESDGKHHRIVGFDSEKNEVILRGAEDNEFAVWRNPKKDVHELVDYLWGFGSRFTGVLED